jgi:hypothetical protein
MVNNTSEKSSVPSWLYLRDAGVVQHMQIYKCNTQHINRRKDNNYLIISIDSEKAFDKFQHHFMIKVLRQLRIEGMYLNISTLFFSPTAEERIKKMWYLYTMEFYSPLKKNEILSLASKWKELENIILSKVSQPQKVKTHMFSLICRF